MTQIKERLFDAFREDHAILGRGFYDLAQSLRAEDDKAARRLAERLDEQSGAHIAFEEQHFYPALVRTLGEEDVMRMRAEHARGLSVIKTLLNAPPGSAIASTDRNRLIDDTEAMQEHIAECGELFGAMGAIPPDEQRALLDKLEALRKVQPKWTDYAAAHDT